MEANRELHRDARQQRRQADPNAVVEVFDGDSEDRARDQEDQHHRCEHRPQIERRPPLHLDHCDELGVRLYGRPTCELTLPDLSGHPLDGELFNCATGIKTDARGVGDENHLVLVPDERLNAHLKRFAIERKAAKVEIRPKCRRYRELVLDGTVGRNFERAVRHFGFSGVNELELRPPHFLQLFGGGILEESLRLGAGEGESRIVPAEAEVQVGFEGLAALGGCGQICEEEPGGDLDGRFARRQPRFSRSPPGARATRAR